MRERNNKTTLTALAPLLLFVIFTPCILAVLLTGADIYKKISLRDQNSFRCRTGVQYLTTRLRQNDADSTVFVGDFHTGAADTTLSNGDTLFLREEWDGRTFYTRIYCHEGYLYELFSEETLAVSKKYGEPILEMNALHFSVQGNLLQIEIEHADSTTETLILFLRSEKEGI